MAIFLDEMLNVNENKEVFSGELQQLSEKMNCTQFQNRFCREDGGIEICYEAEVALNELDLEMGGYEFKALQEAEGEGEAKEKSVWAKIKDKVKEFFNYIWGIILKIWNGVKGFFEYIIKYFNGKADEELKKRVADAEAKATADEKKRITDILAVELVYDPDKMSKPINTCREAFNKFFVATDAYLSMTVQDQAKKDEATKKRQAIDKAEGELLKAIEALNAIDMDVKIQKNKNQQYAKQARSASEINGYIDKIDGYKSEFQNLAKKCDETVKKGKGVCEYGKKLADAYDAAVKADKSKDAEDKKEAVAETKKQASKAAKATQITSRLMQTFFNKIKTLRQNYKKALQKIDSTLKQYTKRGL